jgi:hypothetical protein
MIPFAKTRAERLARAIRACRLRSAMARTRGYVQAVSKAAAYAASTGFLLQADGHCLDR